MRRINGMQLLTLAACILASVTALYHYQMHTAYRRQVESHYRLAFRELISDIQTIAAQLDTLPVATQPLRAQIWAEIVRSTYNAQANLGRLPVLGIDTARLQAYFVQLQNSSRADDQENLSVLRRTAQLISTELETAVREFEHSSWTGWVRHFVNEASRTAPVIPCQDRYPILHVLVQLEEGLSSFDTSKQAEQSSLQDRVLLDTNQAARVVRDFLPTPPGPVIQTNETAGEQETYVFQAGTASIAVCRQHGTVVWFVDHEMTKPGLVDGQEFHRVAVQFLQRQGLSDVELFEWKAYPDRAVFFYAVVEEEVVFYTETVIVQVAAETEEVVGFFRSARGAPVSWDLAQVLDAETAAAGLVPKGTIGTGQLAVIPNGNQTRLSYRFLQDYDQQAYYVFVDAFQGDQLKIERIMAPEQLFFLSW